MRFYELPEGLAPEIARYAEWVRDYLSGAVDRSQLKAVTAPMGIYEQRNSEHYMLRIRLPGGAITPEQLRGVALIAEQYTRTPLHLTTRQNIQIHNLHLSDTVPVMRELKALGLSSRGGGGNTLRNIICPWDCGLDPEEAFDVEPYVRALTTRMMAEPDSWTLPRKFKVAFSGSAKDKGLATVNDLGFIARKNSAGAKGFAVYIGGGLGLKSQPGFLLYEFVADTEVYNITKAAKVLFDKYGDRQNRQAARLRFVRARWGEAEFTAKFVAELQAVRAQNYPALELKARPAGAAGFLQLPLFLGDLPLEQAKFLGWLMQDYGVETIRITPEQNLLLRNLEPSSLRKLRRALSDAGLIQRLPTVLERATVCTGASTCKLGVARSRDLIMAIRQGLETELANWPQLSDLTLKISGCPNACGQHLLADIGFYGVIKRVEGRSVPFYHLLVGGTVGAGRTKLAAEVALLPAEQVPAFLQAFLTWVARTREPAEDFSGFLARVGLARIKELAREYSGLTEVVGDCNAVTGALALSSQCKYR